MALPISLLSTAYVPTGLLPGWVRAAAAVNPYSHVVDAVRAAMAGTLHAGRLTTGLAAVAATVALTQLAAARRFAGPASSTATDRRQHGATGRPVSADAEPTATARVTGITGRR